MIIPSFSRNIWLFVSKQTYQYFNTSISKKVKLEDLLSNEMSIGGSGPHWDDRLQPLKCDLM